MNLAIEVTSVPARLQRLLTLASQKGFNLRENLDGTLSVVNVHSGKAFGRWNGPCGAVQFLKRY